MTHLPFRLPYSASAFDGYRHDQEHIVYLRGRRRARLSVVSERDLFALQRVDLVRLARAISNAAGLPELPRLRTDIHRLVDSMLAHGASASQLTYIIVAQ